MHTQALSLKLRLHKWTALGTLHALCQLLSESTARRRWPFKLRVGELHCSGVPVLYQSCVWSSAPAAARPDELLTKNGPGEPKGARVDSEEGTALAVTRRAAAAAGP